jgi:hypothetical protein
MQQRQEMLAACEMTNQRSLLPNAPYVVGLSIATNIIVGFPGKAKHQTQRAIMPENFAKMIAWKVSPAFILY